MSIVGHARIRGAATVAVIAGAALLLWQLDTSSARRASSSGNPGPWTVAQAQAFPDYTVYWLGEEYQGLPLTELIRSVADDNPKLPIPTSKDGFDFNYGSCTIKAGNNSCPIPLAIQVEPRCYLPPEVLSADFKRGPVRTVRGGAELQVFGASVVIWTGEVAVTVIAADPYRVAQDLRPINRPGDAAAALPAPNKAPCSKIMGRPRDEVMSRLAPPLWATPAIDTSGPTAIAPPAPDSPSATCCSLQLDMDPATPGVQAARTVTGQQDISIDVVLGDTVGELGGFNFSLVYDDTRLAPVTPGATGINGNPDFNDAALGAGWSCSLPAASGRADIDAATGASHGVAFLACVVTGTPPSISSATVVATLQLRVMATGPSDIAISDAQFAHYDATDIGSCNPVINAAAELTCAGGSVTRE